MTNKKYEDQRPYIPAETQRAVKVEAGHKCSVKDCLEHTYVEIHHINEDRNDNSLKNLILLCDKHHKMAHRGVIDRKSLHEYKTALNNPVGTIEVTKEIKLEKIDEFILKVSCEEIIKSNENKKIITEELISNLSDEFARNNILDSLNVLDQNGYIDLKKALSPIPTYFKISQTGFETYLKSHYSEYYEVRFKIISLILAEENINICKLALSSGQPEVVITHILYMFEKEEYLKLNKSWGPPLSVYEIYPKLKRYYKNQKLV